MDEAKLRDIPLFAKLSRKQRKLLALRADEVDVPPGSFVCRKGDSANELYVIEEGTAKVVRDEQYLDELGPGDFFGEMGVLDDAPRNANVVATTPLTLMILSGPALRQLEREQPQLASRISATIEQRRHWLEPVL
jgi:CRP-like cAMP-binding protein